MQVREITKHELSLYLKDFPPTGGLFLQTPDWCEFEKDFGYETKIFGIFDQELVGTAVVAARRIRGGFKYFYIARGPLVKKADIFKSVIESLVEYFKNMGLFLKIEPSIKKDGASLPVSFVGSQSIQPPATLIMDLSVSEEELLKKMHQKTRYNINLSFKKGLVWSLGGVEKWPEAWQLFEQTAMRDGFSLHSAEHYKKMLTMFANRPPGQDLSMRLALVHKNYKLLAASILVFYKDYVTYLHGASGNDDRELMPTYLLHWNSILEAKKMGYKFYDWWGISSKTYPKNKWEGITRFKLGFGGEVIDYSGAADYPYNKALYFFYKLAVKIIR